MTDRLANFGDKRHTHERRVQAWCFLCGSEHRWGEVCLIRAGIPERDQLVCAWCGDLYVPGPRRHVYCGSECRALAKSERDRKRHRA